MLVWFGMEVLTPFVVTVEPVYSGHLGTPKTILIIEVSLFHRVIYTHLYFNGITTDRPYFRVSTIAGLTVYTWAVVIIYMYMYYMLGVITVQHELIVVLNFIQVGRHTYTVKPAIVDTLK